MQARIDIDISYTRAVCEQFRVVAIHVRNIGNSVSSIGASVESGILSRHNLSARLRNARKEIERIKTELLQINRVITQNINEYESLENRLRLKVDDLPTI